MTKLEFERLLIPLIKIFDEIELDLIRNILDRIDNYDGVKGSLEWYTDKLIEFKALDKTNVKIFKNNKKELKKIIQMIAEDCGYSIDNIEKLKEYYDKGLIEVNPLSLYDSVAINSLVNDAIKDTKDIMDLIQTKAIEGANQSYKNILNKAYIETASGTYTYTEAIRHALDDFAKKGIQVVHYKNGKTLSIESVTRRDVITRMNKLVGDIEIQHAKDLGTNLMYVDQHLGARVRTKYTKHDYEAHAEWQGKKYMIEGSSKEYPNLYQVTGYGEMLGLKGINCYHNMRPTWEWEKIDQQISLEENKKVRDILDKRNYYARKSRELKHRKLNAQMLGDTEKYKKLTEKQAEFNEEYNDFLKENNLQRDYNREHISTSKSSNTNIGNYEDATEEWIKNAMTNSHKVIDRNYFMDKDGNKYEVDGKNVVLDYSKNEKNVAEWLENTFGGEIYMVPRINNPKGIETPDYIWNGEYWDLKEINGIGKRTIDTAIKKKKNQSHNFIIDITNSKLTKEQSFEQLTKIYTNKDRIWVDKIILKKNNDLVKILKRKKEINHQSQKTDQD